MPSQPLFAYEFFRFVAANQLTGPIPTEVGLMTYLTQLYLCESYGVVLRVFCFADDTPQPVFYMDCFVL